MNKIPYKVRVALATGLFLWAILAIIFTIVYAYYNYQLWIVIVGPILAIVSFVFSIILMPKTQNEITNNTSQPKTVHHHRNSYHKNKKPFISEKEWEELEEEEEEILAMEEVDDA